MKRIAGIILVFLMLPFGLYASESLSFDAYIDSVSGGVKGFGLGLFPLGTTFGFERYYQIVPGENRAEFQIELSFAFNNSSLSTDMKKGQSICSTTLVICCLMFLFGSTPLVYITAIRCHITPRFHPLPLHRAFLTPG